jgi:DnaJ-class molecular chaperone
LGVVNAVAINILYQRSQMNLYDELELYHTCSDEDIKRQYRSLAQQHHPDKGGDEERFKRIKLAYEVLSDPARRREYDETGKYHMDNSIRTQAMERLNNMISHFTGAINPEFDDLIVHMKNDIRRALTATENDIQACNNVIRKLNIALNKIKLKQEGENVLRGFTSNKIKQREDDLVNFKRNIQIFVLMLDILDDYHFSDNEWMIQLPAADTATEESPPAVT